ncbi:hypothetical protein MCETE7_02082 [Acidimicrobiia bacterium]
MSRTRRRPASAQAQGGQKKLAAERAAAKKFWGESTLDDPALVRMSSDPAALMLSLGEPPLRGSEKAAQAAFTLVYRKAAQLALLAATAAGLDDDSFGV